MQTVSVDVRAPRLASAREPRVQVLVVGLHAAVRIHAPELAETQTQLGAAGNRTPFACQHTLRVTSSCPRGGSLDGSRADSWSEREGKTHRCVAALARSEHPGALRDQQLRHGQHRVEVQLWVRSACAPKGWARGKPKAIENLGDRRLLSDRGDEPKCSAAPRAFGTYVEHTAKKSRPVHVRTRGRDAPTIGSLCFGLRGGRRARKRGRHVRGLGHRRHLWLART